MSGPKQQPVFETTSETYLGREVHCETKTSIVFRVDDSEGNLLALKCLKPEFVATTRVKRFLNELNFCQSCAQANIIRIIDNGFVFRGEVKCPFYVMPFYDSTLRKIMKAGVSGTNVRRYFGQILDGIEAAHLKGVWHRDLKPENVLHDPATDSLIVSDFGIAHFAAEWMHETVETDPHDRMANFEYAAPEQRRSGNTVDQRADIYALGLILNEMFTRHVPLGSGFTTVGEVAPDFAYLDELIEQMRQQRPENRPNSIEEIKRVLIVREDEFARGQKLDRLRKTDVPVSNISHPLVDRPPQVQRIDIQGNALVLVLDQSLPLEWLKEFSAIIEAGYETGTGPHKWTFSTIGSQTHAAVVLPPQYMSSLPAKQFIVDKFKECIALASDRFRLALERSARAKEEGQRRVLREQIAEEERRRKLLEGLRV